VNREERIAQLEADKTGLREELKKTDVEKRYAETQKIRHEREIRKLQGEIEKLRSTPLIIGTITEVLDNDRVVVRSSFGVRFLVRISQLIDPEKIKPGARCSMNEQSHAIVEILPPGPETGLEEDPGNIIKVRYARGEISREQYLEMLETLNKK
jgi:proteasome regulatory subunit